MKRGLFLLLSVLTTLAALSLPTATTATKTSKADPVVAAPATVGLSSTRLANIRTVMSRHVANKNIPGAIGLIARHGKVAYQETWGMADMEAGTPMQMDTIHHIYSMSKPITSVALMMLYEAGRQSWPSAPKDFHIFSEIGRAPAFQSKRDNLSQHSGGTCRP
jgi:CubicO group peptidase (beta-lactamase class C family)